MEIKRVREHLYSIEQGFVRCFAVVDRDQAWVIDAGAETGLRSCLETLTTATPHLILTHSDGDHTAACQEFPDMYLHPSEMARFCAKNGGAFDLRPVREGQVLEMGPYQFKVVLIPGHTPGSIALWEKQQRFLISGDSVTNATTFMFGEGRSLNAYHASLIQLLTLEKQLDIIYGSHGPVEVPVCRIQELIELTEGWRQGQITGCPAARFDGSVQEVHWKGASIYIEQTSA